MKTVHAPRRPAHLGLWTLLVAGLAATPKAASAQQTVPSRITLGDAARMAAERGADAVSARERAHQSRARAYQSRADLLPSLTSDGLIDGGSDEGSTNGPAIPAATGGGLGSDRTLDMRLQITQPVFDLAAAGRWRASGAEADAAKADALAVAEAAAEQGALAYLRVLSAEGRLVARIADSALAAELLDMSRQQLLAGTAIALDVTRSESQLASAISQLITVRSERARAELELIRVLALPLNGRLELVDALGAPDPAEAAPTDAEAVGIGLASRGEIQAAAAMAEAARERTGAVRAERLPSVSLFAAAGSNAEGLLDHRSYGVRLSMPLFDGFRREARVAESRAREREAETQWEDARLRTEVEIRSALVDLRAARERVAAAGVQQRLAEQEVSQARERFNAGVAGNADVISASLALNEARSLVVDALTDYHAARVGLAAAQGRTTRLP